MNLTVITVNLTVYDSEAEEVITVKFTVLTIKFTVITVNYVDHLSVTNCYNSES